MVGNTRAGDGGETRAPDGRVLPKSDPLLEALGSVDELNSHLGLCLAAASGKRHAFVREALEPLQAELMRAATTIAGAAGPPLPAGAVERLERQIDRVWADLPALTSFLLPRGCKLACRLHVARTVARRAERAVVAAANAGAGVGGGVLPYLNRLSDLLFALARQANHDAGECETPWMGRAAT